MREIRQSGSEGGEEFKPLSLPLSWKTLILEKFVIITIVADSI